MQRNKKRINNKTSVLYKCRWCNKEKSDKAFYKCSIENHSYICTECITQKYKEIICKHEKYKALMVCCHYLDIAFFFDIYKSLEIGQGLGYYIRQLNLLQNRNPDSYEKGILKDCSIDYTPTEYSNTYLKSKLDDVIKELEVIKNDI